MKENTYWDKNCGKLYQYNETKAIDEVCNLIIKNCESVFEASCGSGIIPTVLRKKGFKGKYVGSDYCQVFLTGAKENNPTEEFIEVDLSQPIPLLDNSFDCCVVNHGLEYVYPYELALSELKRIATKFIFLVFWIDFTEKDLIRFNEQGSWQVNYYSRQKFYATLKKLNLEPIVSHLINNNGKINYLYIFNLWKK